MCVCVLTCHFWFGHWSQFDLNCYLEIMFVFSCIETFILLQFSWYFFSFFFFFFVFLLQESWWSSSQWQRRRKRACITRESDWYRDLLPPWYQSGWQVGAVRNLRILSMLSFITLMLSGALVSGYQNLVFVCVAVEACEDSFSGIM